MIYGGSLWSFTDGGGVPPPPDVICVPFRGNVLPASQARLTLAGVSQARNAISVTIVARGTVVPEECENT